MNETAVNARTSRPNARVAAVLGGAGALALVLGGVTLATAPSASADGIVKPGNPTCAQLVPGSTQIKFDPPNSGAKTEDGVTVTLTKRNLAADDPAHPGDQTGNEVVDFAAVGGKVLGVIVKGGPEGANFYDYRPDGSSAGTGLHTPPNEKNQKFSDVSHVTFCVAKPVTTPPTKPTTAPTKPTTAPTKPTTAPTKPTTAPTKPTTAPTKPTTAPTKPTTAPTNPTTAPTKPTTAPTNPTTAPTATPSTTAPEPEPTASTPVAVPTEVDAGLTGGGSAGTPSTGDRIAWGAGLLLLGGALLLGGVLKLRQRKGLHSA